jgi:hypothetical protein
MPARRDNDRRQGTLRMVNGWLVLHAFAKQDVVSFRKGRLVCNRTGAGFFGSWRAWQAGW